MNAVDALFNLPGDDVEYHIAPVDPSENLDFPPNADSFSARSGVPVDTAGPPKKKAKIGLHLFEPNYDPLGKPQNLALPQIRAMVAEHTWPKGKARANMHKLLGLIHEWSQGLVDKVAFDDFLRRTQKLGSNLLVRQMLEAERNKTIQFRSQDADSDVESEHQEHQEVPTADALWEAAFEPRAEPFAEPEPVIEPEHPVPASSENAENTRVQVDITDAMRQKMEENRLRALRLRQERERQQEADDLASMIAEAEGH